MQPNDLDHNHNQSDCKEILKTHHHDFGRCSSHRLGLGRSCVEILGAAALFVTKQLKHHKKRIGLPLVKMFIHQESKANYFYRFA